MHTKDVRSSYIVWLMGLLTCLIGMWHDIVSSISLMPILLVLISILQVKKCGRVICRKQVHQIVHDRKSIGCRARTWHCRTVTMRQHRVQIVFFRHDVIL
jgi:hypothetical protein